MVYIHNLIYGGREITDQNVRQRFIDTISTKSAITVSNTNLGGDPQPGVVKTCQVRYRYYDGVGPLGDLSATEGSTLDFGMPVITQLTYGGQDLRGNSAVFNRVVDAIRNWRRLGINNDNMGGDPSPGQTKEFVLTYRRAPSFPLSQFINNEYSTIYFERAVYTITYGNTMLFEKPFVYAKFNYAFQNCYFNNDSDAHIYITNDTLEGDPLPGTVKTCLTTFDAWDSYAKRPYSFSVTKSEGEKWPRDEAGLNLPGITYYPAQGKWGRSPQVGPNPN